MLFHHSNTTTQLRKKTRNGAIYKYVGISRRHIYGSKIASSLLLQNPKNPKKIGPNRRAKWVTLSDFLTSILLQTIKKFERDPLELIKQCQRFNWFLKNPTEFNPHTVEAYRDKRHTCYCKQDI